MLDHLHPHPSTPDRIVILGAAGFVGSALKNNLDTHRIKVEPLTRAEIDLLDEHAGDQLAGRLRESDTLVIISAKAPCRNASMLEQNIRMMVAVGGAIEKVPPTHVIYVSSDAVYADSTEPLHEASPAAPESLHGVMHLARELMLKDSVSCPLAILRPTLIYGADDPHNGYGPNRFRRLAAAGEEIVLFGEGEERRDHVAVEDVAELIRLIAMHRSRGILNAATGSVASFRQIAEFIGELFGGAVAISGSPRQGPMPHGGYRPFDPAATTAAFPEFTYTPLLDGLKRIHRLTTHTN